MGTLADHFDLDHLSELRLVMEDDFPTLVITYVNDSRGRVEKLRQVVQLGDAVGVRAVAHSFKGSAINMGATLLAELCRQLEDMGRSAELEGADALLARIVDEYLLSETALEAYLNS